MLLADKLKELMRRAGHGTNVARAAEFARVKYTTLQDIYTGKTTSPKPDTTRKIAAAYHVRLEWLLDEAAGFADVESLEPVRRPSTEQKAAAYDVIAALVRAISTDEDAPADAPDEERMAVAGRAIARALRDLTGEQPPDETG